MSRGTSVSSALRPEWQPAWLADENDRRGSGGGFEKSQPRRKRSASPPAPGPARPRPEFLPDEAARRAPSPVAERLKAPSSSALSSSQSSPLTTIFPSLSSPSKQARFETNKSGKPAASNQRSPGPALRSSPLRTVSLSSKPAAPHLVAGRRSPASVAKVMRPAAHAVAHPPPTLAALAHAPMPGSTAVVMDVISAAQVPSPARGAARRLSTGSLERKRAGAELEASSRKAHLQLAAIRQPLSAVEALMSARPVQKHHLEPLPLNPAPSGVRTPRLSNPARSETPQEAVQTIESSAPDLVTAPTESTAAAVGDLQTTQPTHDSQGLPAALDATMALKHRHQRGSVFSTYSSDAFVPTDEASEGEPPHHDDGAGVIHIASEHSNESPYSHGQEQGPSLVVQGQAINIPVHHLDRFRAARREAAANAADPSIEVETGGLAFVPASGSARKLEDALHLAAVGDPKPTPSLAVEELDDIVDEYNDDFEAPPAENMTPSAAAAAAVATAIANDANAPTLSPAGRILSASSSQTGSKGSMRTPSGGNKGTSTAGMVGTLSWGNLSGGSGGSGSGQGTARVRPASARLWGPGHAPWQSTNAIAATAAAMLASAVTSPASATAGDVALATHDELGNGSVSAAHSEPPSSRLPPLRSSGSSITVPPLAMEAAEAARIASLSTGSSGSRVSIVTDDSDG